MAVELVNDPADLGEEDKTPRGTATGRLVSWVVSRVDTWNNDRDTNHKDRWEEYYRLWRGIWAPEDKNRKSERSRIITPALQQAVEGVASEIESAVLDKPHFFDVIESPEKDMSADVEALRARLRTDMKEADFELAMNQIFFMGSLWGTGIGKLVPGEAPDVSIQVDPVTGQATAVEDSRVLVTLVPVLPMQFAIDPAARNVKEALGVAHCYSTPLHEVEAMQDSGVYFDYEIGPETPDDPILSDEDETMDAEAVNIIEYYGKVPRGLLKAAQDETLVGPEDELVDLLAEDETDADAEDLVEALITIGNKGTLLKARENPTLLKERPIFAYRHEIVPDQFWGRGVAEKGYNPQKALDASVRARLDGLALMVHPMVGIDASRMPRGFSFSVQPGKSILTNGNPGEILSPFKFGNMDPNVFTNTSELERMVSMATGGFDTAAPVTVNNRNETASGMSMMLGSFVKRSKRTIRNIEKEFTIPMVSSVARLYMQLDPERYPAVPVKFKAVSVLGTMARELEQSQFSAMLQTVPAQSPAFWMLIKSIYQLSSLSNREEMVTMIDQELQKALNPAPPPPDPLIEIKRMEAIGKVRTQAAQIQVEYIRAQAEIIRAANDTRNAASTEAKSEAQAILYLAQAQAQNLNASLEIYQAQLDALERNHVGANEGLATDVITRTENTRVGSTLEDLLNFGVGNQAQATGGGAAGPQGNSG